MKLIVSHIKVAHRYLAKNKFYTAINIFGLVLGLTCYMMLMLYIRHELSFDKHHNNYERIYRVIVKDKTDSNSSITGANLVSLMKNSFPEVNEAVRFAQGWSCDIRYKDKYIKENSFGFADSNFFEIFKYNMIEGALKNALKDPTSVVITESSAKKYFGSEDPLNKVITVNNNFLKVAGVIEDLPCNTDLRFDFIANIGCMRTIIGSWIESKGIGVFNTFLVLGKDCSSKELERKIPGAVAKHDEDLTSDNTEQYKLQKLEDMHLYSQNISGIEIKGNLEELYIYFIVAMVILLISCINFINITISSSSTRLKEIALRKTLGADRKQLIYQFCGESLLIVSISVVFSMVLTTLLLPVYNSLWGIKVTGNIFLRADVIIAVISLSIIISVISGAYISFYVSRMNPAKIFGGAVLVGVKSSFVRYALVLVQFTVALVMIIYVEIIHSQYLHIKNKDLGFNAASLLQIELSKYANKNKYELFQNIAKENPLIENVSGASVIFPKKNITSDLSDNKERADKQITNENFWFVDPNFIDVLKLRLNKGRNFTSEITSKMNDEVILNKKAANVLGWANQVGKTIYNEVTNKNYIIIGTVDNFHFENLKMDIKPVVLAINKGMLTNIIIRVKQKNTSQAIKYLNGIWNNIFPEQPFNYNIVTDRFEQMNNSLNNLFYLFTYFSVIAIVIAFLGIIGLSSFSIEKRKKEIAIRKVLGANPFEIIGVISKEYIIMSVVSNLIGWPIAYYVIEKWLESYASRIDVKLEYFIIPSIMIILITFLTVAFQMIRTLSKNPADSLNTE